MLKSQFLKLYRRSKSSNSDLISKGTSVVDGFMIPKRMPHNSKHKRTAETQKTLTPLFSQRQFINRITGFYVPQRTPIFQTIIRRISTIYYSRLIFMKVHIFRLIYFYQLQLQFRKKYFRSFTQNLNYFLIQINVLTIYLSFNLNYFHYKVTLLFLEQTSLLITNHLHIQGFGKKVIKSFQKF